jgi:hypothetical protein
VTQRPDDLETRRELIQPDKQLCPAELEDQYQALYPYLRMSPEEYVARRSHGILCFGLHRFEYRDTRLTQWFESVHALLHNRKRVHDLRRQYLTPAEITEAEWCEQNP